MKKYFIDTNIFMRTLIKENKTSFENCYQLLRMVKLGKIKALTASLILAEIVWTLSSYYQFPKENVIQAIKGIISLRGLKIIDNYNPPFSLNLFSQKKVKYIGALIASIEEIQTKKWIVVSYDKDFDKLGVTRKEPEEINSQGVS